MAYQLFTKHPTGSFQAFYRFSFERTPAFKLMQNALPSPKPTRKEDYTKILFLFVFLGLILLYVFGFDLPVIARTYFGKLERFCRCYMKY